MAKATGKLPPKYVREAIKCGQVPRFRNLDNLDPEEMTDGERVLAFAETYLCFGEGMMRGQPMVLSESQKAFILAAFSKESGHISQAIYSCGRRSGKTFVTSVILLNLLFNKYLVKPGATLASSAMTREQAGLIYRTMAAILECSPEIPTDFYRLVPSSKQIHSLKHDTWYKSLARDTTKGSNLGMALYCLVVDEMGSIANSTDQNLDALFSSMGSFSDSKVFLISTSAPSDMAAFSLACDRAERDQPKNVVSHIYRAPNDDITDEKNWWAANPGLHDGFRDLADIRRSAEEAKAIPAKANAFLNLFLNRRVSLEQIWVSSSVWKQNMGEPDWEVFRKNGVHLGLDLSSKFDLTACTMSSMDDDGIVHAYPFCFTPGSNIEERERKDRAPYSAWVNTGELIPVPGGSGVISYDWVAAYLRENILNEDIDVLSVQFDRWRINDFAAACEREGFPVENFQEVGQGYRDFSPRLEASMTMMMENRLRVGNVAPMNMAASQAIVTTDPSGSIKIDKAKSVGGKIDPLVALVMSVYPWISQVEETVDVGSMIG